MAAKLSWNADGADWPNRAHSRFVEAAGYRWHVQTMGSGPTALLAHGTGSAIHSWRSLAPLLAKHFTVVAPDLPGHGRSQGPALKTIAEMADWTAALLDAAGAAKAQLIGHTASKWPSLPACPRA